MTFAITNCPVCSGQIHLFDRIRDINTKPVDILDCRECGAIINNDAYEALTNSTPHELQATDFYTNWNHDKDTVQREINSANGMLDHLERVTYIDRSNSTFLDFGAGCGYVAAAAASRYKQVTACEWDTRSLQRTLSLMEPTQPTFDIISDIKNFSGSADILFMWHTLEHLPEPSKLWRDHLHTLSRHATIFLQIPMYRPAHVVQCHHVFYTERSLSAFAHAIDATPIDFGYDVNLGFLSMIAKRNY